MRSIGRDFLEGFFLIWILVGAQNVYPQILNQDSDGKSTIVWAGTSLTLDLSEGMAKANYYSFSKRPAGPVWGIDVQTKKGSRAADLFENENMTPQTAISGLCGWSYTNFKLSDHDKKIENELNDLNQRIDKIGQEAENRYNSLVESSIIGCGDNIEETASVRNKLKFIFRQENF
ncbi:hypothetical protein JW935_18595 [candidate division KSB1 bacterium]|nr:hypothetical protein [candidate division KSB1 bacterium]